MDAEVSPVGGARAREGPIERSSDDQRDIVGPRRARSARGGSAFPRPPVVGCRADSRSFVAPRPLIEQPWVQMVLAEAYCRLKAMRVMNARMAWELEQGQPDPARASAAKVYGTECVIEVYRLLLQVPGPMGAIQAESAGALANGELERQSRLCQINTFGGGVNEIQREIVAMLGLRMPRVPR